MRLKGVQGAMPRRASLVEPDRCDRSGRPEDLGSEDLGMQL